MKGAVIKFSVAEGIPCNRSISAIPASRVARQLALSYYIEQAVESGVLKDYAHAARVLGLTRARLSQILNLKRLSPTIQAQILTGKIHTWERRLRLVLQTPVWKEQENLFMKI